MKKIILIFISLLFLNYTFANIDVYFFYWIWCPYCEIQKEYFEELKENYDFNIKEYEIYQNKNNLVLMKRFSDAYNWNFNGVPITIIWNDYFLWANKNKTENLLKEYSSITNYTNPYNIVLYYENKNIEEVIEEETIIANKKPQKPIETIKIIPNNENENIEKQKKIYNCINPWWEILKHEESIITYKSEIWFTDEPCLKETRTCLNWTLNWTYSYKKCEQNNITNHEYEKINENQKLEKENNDSEYLAEHLIKETIEKENLKKPNIKKTITLVTVLLFLWWFISYLVTNNKNK